MHDETQLVFSRAAESSISLNILSSIIYAYGENVKVMLTTTNYLRLGSHLVIDYIGFRPIT